MGPLLCNLDDPGTLRHSDDEKACILQNPFCSVFTHDPEGEVPQLDLRMGERLETLEITHDCIMFWGLLE